jgi:hypothetical protein
MRALAKSRGGKCLSKEYTNAETDLKWQCGYGHIWLAPAQRVKYYETWCPVCAGSKKLILDIVKERAIERGGKCLSKRYKNNTIKMHFECKERHRFWMQCCAVQRGSWCPRCRIRVTERIAHEIFNRLFGVQFKKRRPDWLVNPKSGWVLELDGYNEELKLAFEYNGAQHYRAYGGWISKMRVKQQREKDIVKRKLCKHRGVTLIQIPDTIEKDELANYIIAACKKYNVKIINPDVDLNYRNFRIYDMSRLEELQAIAAAHGGRCLSRAYIDANTKLYWECENQHRFYSAPSIVRRGSWCVQCVYDRRKFNPNYTHATTISQRQMITV